MLLGVCGHLFRSGENWRGNLDEAVAIGADVVRFGVEWNRIEPGQKGSYDQDEVDLLDSIIRYAASHGIGCLVIAVQTPCWASRSPKDLQGRCTDPNWMNMPPTKPGDYGHFVAWLTDRYSSNLAGVEVWNEPNAPGDNFVSPVPAQDYTLLVKAANNAATNRVPVIAGALYSGGSQNLDLAFMDQLFLDPTFKSSFDIWSTHSYAGQPDGVINKVKSRRDKLTAKGCSAPIWVDEFGWTTATVSEQDQATRLEQAFGKLKVKEAEYGIRAALCFCLRDRGADPTNTEHRYGLIREDYSHKPAFDAVRTQFA